MVEGGILVMTNYAYNNVFCNYEKLSYLPYNIITHLFKNEKIWRLIKYTTNDALSSSHPDLTAQEKADLVWAGQDNQENYSVFVVPLEENIEYKSKVILKLYIAQVKPQTSAVSQVTFCIEILCQSKTTVLEDRRSRIDVLWSEIMGEILGKEIGGITDLYFNDANVSDSGIDLPHGYTGRITTIGTKYGQVKNR